MQELDLFEHVENKPEGYNEVLLNCLFKAYLDTRKNKRNTVNQLRFELDYEQQLFALHDEIVARTYKPQRSICFITRDPVQREIFAAGFRDRVIHHLLCNDIAPLFEKIFINDSYSCRKGKGTHYGVSRIRRFMRACSHNYTQNCHILKLDIKAYFMSINRDLLYRKLESELLRKQHNTRMDMETILYLLKTVVFYDPVSNCVVKGSKTDWKGLPHDKSLFYAREGCGLPIGNLTSQLFGNVYMNSFDHWVKQQSGIKYYGRYVDDFVLIHPDKEYLKSLIPLIRDYLKDELCLDLHPNKIYLQPLANGVKYLGVVIRPNRCYIANRTKNNFYEAIMEQNRLIESREVTATDVEQFISSLNSYLGILKHYKTFKIRKGFIQKHLSPQWWQYCYIDGGFTCFKKKRAALCAA